jgi:hypothetical protein
VKGLQFVSKSSIIFDPRCFAVELKNKGQRIGKLTRDLLFLFFKFPKVTEVGTHVTANFYRFLKIGQMRETQIMPKINKNKSVYFNLIELAKKSSRSKECEVCLGIITLSD